MRRALLAVVALVAVLATPVQASSADAPAAPRSRLASWYLVGEDGDVLARARRGRARAIASITKLMTAVVVLEHARLDDVVRVSPLAAGVGESTVYLRAGEELDGRRAPASDARPERERRRRGARASRRRRICRSLRRAHERESRRARPERHALRESPRARPARPRVQRARRDGAAAICARCPVHPRRAPAFER